MSKTLKNLPWVPRRSPRPIFNDFRSISGWFFSSTFSFSKFQIFLRMFVRNAYGVDHATSSWPVDKGLVTCYPHPKIWGRANFDRNWQLLHTILLEKLIVQHRCSKLAAELVSKSCRPSSCIRRHQQRLLNVLCAPREIGNRGCKRQKQTVTYLKRFCTRVRHEKENRTR